MPPSPFSVDEQTHAVDSTAKEKEQNTDSNGGILPRFDAKAWPHILTWTEVNRMLLEYPTTIPSHRLSLIIKWLRSNASLDEYLTTPAYEGLLARVLQSSSPRYINQARQLVHNELRILRPKKAKQHRETTEREAVLLRMQIMLHLDQADQTVGRLAHFATDCPPPFTLALLLPTLEAVLDQLISDGKNQQIADLAVDLFPRIPFLGQSSVSESHQGVVQRVRNAVSRLPDAGLWLHRRRDSLQDTKPEEKGLLQRQNRWARIIVLQSLIGKVDRQAEALAVFHMMLEEKDELNQDLVSSLYAWLGKSDMSDEAISVYWELRRSGPLHSLALRRALRLMARTGRVPETDDIVEEMQQQGMELNVNDDLSLLQSRAKTGDIAGTEELARDLFPGIGPLMVVPADQTTLPLDAVSLAANRKAMSVLLAAHVGQGSLEGSLRYLQAILASETPPTLVEFNMILKLFAQRGDSETAQEVFQQIQAVGLQPDRISYTTLISLHAYRRDPNSALEVYETMRAAGIQPDAITLSSLINAYVEAGTWSAAAEIWRSLDDGLRRNRSVVGVMLKGLVLLGAPFQDVLQVFRDAYRASNSADERAWALVIQSACDAGRLDAALDLYEEMASIVDGEDSRLQLGPHVFSILLVGYLRKNDATSARAVLKEMEDRGVRPTSVTQGIIIKAIADGKWSKEGLSEESYVDKVMSDGNWADHPSKSRGEAVENILAPMISSHGKRMDTEAAEGYFKRIVADGVQPTVLTYTTLLDAFRRAEDVEGLDRVWKALMRHVVQTVHRADGLNGSAVIASQQNMMCIPLSIYIDGLTAAYRHADVARVWRDVAELGFAFDAHNWNHLAIALLRAGEVERAFQVTEEVLIPHHEEVLQRRVASERVGQLGSRNEPPAGTDASHVEGDFQMDPAQRPPNRRHQYRRGGRDELALELATAKESGEVTGSEHDDTGNIRMNVDLFDRWRPSDIMWRPAYLTVAVMERAYAKLQQGRAVLALSSSEEEEMEEIDIPTAQLQADTDSEHQEATRVGSGSAVEDTDEPRPVLAASDARSSPQLLLARINSKYAKTVGLIMLHRRKRRDQYARRSRRD